MTRSFPLTLRSLAFLLAFALPALAGAQVGPAGVNTGIVLWLDGANVNNSSPASSPSNAQAVTTWKDVSGNGNNARVLSGQSGGTMRAASMNGKDVVSFTRTSQYSGTVFEVPNVDIRATQMPQMTIFTVYRQGSWGSGELHAIWGDDNGGWDRFFMSAFGSTNGVVSVGPPTNNVSITNSGTVGDTKLQTTVYDNGASNGSTVYFNALPVQSVTDNTDLTAAQTSFRIGWDGDDNPFNGDIAEMIVYSRKLSDCEITQVNRYLGQKYNVPLTTATISPAGTNYLCSGNSVTLTGTSAIPGTATYAWLRNGSLISGANAATYTASQAGSYRVIATVGTCSDTSVATTVITVPQRIYVAGSVTASGDGSSWSSAVKTLSEGLFLANRTGCTNEIWVKAGTYLPMSDSGTAITSRDSSFRIVRNGLKVYGGFAGTETALSNRNITTNPTILSGDIGIANDSSDNSWHVVTVVGGVTGAIDTTTRLDGFTITRGNGNASYQQFIFGVHSVTGDGGGIAIVGSGSGNLCSPMIANNILERNYANVGGGAYCGAYLGGGTSPYFMNCTVRNNRASDVGGIHAHTSNGAGGVLNPRYVNTKFLNNQASGGGGAIGIYNGGLATNLSYIESCVFSGNSAGGSGGAMNTYTGNASMTFTGCVFVGNTAGNVGGAINAGPGTATLTNCTFSENTATNGGSALRVGGTALVNNTVMWGASTAQVQNNGTTTYVNSDVRGITPPSNSLSLDPLFVNAADPDGADDIFGTSDDGLRLQNCSPVINRGDNTLVPAALTLDYAGAARIQQTTVDMGAYESAVANAYTVINSVIGVNPATCGSNGTITISPAVTGRVYTITYTKNGTAVTASVTGTAAGTIVLNLPAGSYTAFTLSYSGCTSNTASAGPVVLADPPTPAAPTASSNTPVCQGSTVNLSVTGVAGASFSWTGPSSFTSTSATPTVSNLTSSKAGTYSVTQSLAGCVSAAATTVVVMNPLPSQPGSITGPSAPCLGTTNTYSVNAANNAVSYVWTLPGTNWSGTSTTTSISAVTGATSGTISVASVNGCGTSTARNLTVNVNTLPVQPGAITGPTAICNGAPTTYSISAVTNTTGYTWVLPSGWSGSSTGTSIVATPGASSGTVYVIPTNACGSGNSQSINVGVTSIPAQPGVITGATAPCVGTTQMYYIAPVSGATSYSWTYPNGGTPAWNGAVSGTSVSPVVGLNSGNVSVSASNQCGTSVVKSLAVTVTPMPAAAGAISGKAAPCVGSTETYSISPVADATSYNWTFPLTWTGLSNTNAITVIAGTASGTITVTPVGVCGTGTPATISVSGTPIVAPSVTLARSVPTDTICAGTLVTFTATAVNGGASPVYTFRRNGTLLVSSGSNVYTTAALNSGDRISVTMASSLPCVTRSQVVDSMQITVLPVRLPGININTQPPTALCAGQTVMLRTNDTNGGTNPSYQWYLNNAAIQGVTTKTYTPPTIRNGDTFQVVMTSNIACAKFTVAPSNKIGFNVVPVVTPTVSIVANPAGPVPPGTQVTFTATSSNGGANPSFQWLHNGVTVSGATGSTWTSSALASGDEVSVRMLSEAVCASPETVMSNTIRMSVGTTGIAQTAGAFNGSVRLYPNPNTGRFTVEISDARVMPGARNAIDVVNALGQTVYHMVFQPDRTTWSHDVFLNDGLANGTYLLRVSGEQSGATAIPFVLNR